MKGKRIVNYRGHVIWYFEGAYMVALKRDGTDEYFSSYEDAIKAIDLLIDSKK